MGCLVVRKAGPEGRFTRQWKWDPDERCLRNDDLGVNRRVVDMVDEKTGEVKYEAVALESRRIELHTVVRKDDVHFGFVLHRRATVIPPEVSSREFARDPNRVLSVLEYGTGIEEYEASHGLAMNRLEEVLEEIGLAVVQAVPIGFVKESPSLGGPAHEHFAVMVGREASGHAKEANEEISHVRFFPPEEVRRVKTICGLTKASLWSFRSWGLEQDHDSFWYEAAARL